MCTLLSYCNVTEYCNPLLSFNLLYPSFLAISLPPVQSLPSLSIQLSHYCQNCFLLEYKSIYQCQCLIFKNFYYLQIKIKFLRVTLGNLSLKIHYPVYLFSILYFAFKKKCSHSFTFPGPSICYYLYLNYWWLADVNSYTLSGSFHATFFSSPFFVRTNFCTELKDHFFLKLASGSCHCF